MKKSRINFKGTMDAEIWTKEFMKIQKKKGIADDEGTMIGWFANAIMAGYDGAYREMETQRNAETQ